MFGWLFLLLACVAIIAFYIYDYDNGDYFNFLLEKGNIGEWMAEHSFTYFMICFWGTALPAVGALCSFIKLIISIGRHIT